MDLFLRFEIRHDGSTQLSQRAIATLVSLLSDARTRSRRASIELICEENLSILLRLQVHPTMSSDWLSTLSPEELCSVRPARSGRPGGVSGEDASRIPFTLEYGKGE